MKFPQKVGQKNLTKSLTKSLKRKSAKKRNNSSSRDVQGGPGRVFRRRMGSGSEEGLNRLKRISRFRSGSAGSEGVQERFMGCSGKRNRGCSRAFGAGPGGGSGA